MNAYSQNLQRALVEGGTRRFQITSYHGTNAMIVIEGTINLILQDLHQEPGVDWPSANRDYYCWTPNKWAGE